MRVLTLTTPDIENGTGNRVTLWVAGCSRKCPGCHNPHTWDYNQGSELFSEEVLNRLYNEVDKPYIKGITISGGDPLDQSEESKKELLHFIKKFKVKFPMLDIWIYTGALYEDLMNDDISREILVWCDVLVDGPFIQERKQLDLAFRGSDNQRIIDLNASCLDNIVEYKI